MARRGRKEKEQGELNKQEIISLVKDKYKFTEKHLIMSHDYICNTYGINIRTLNSLLETDTFLFYVQIGLAFISVGNTSDTYVFTSYALDDFFLSPEGESLYDKYRKLFDRY